jgi:endonuclease YncB( thermonuclease family)
MASTLLTGAQEIVIESFRDRRSFARWVADVYVDGESLGGLLMAAGHAEAAT